MAYVVARPRGRFEIRESVHTPKGPRARSLANFSRLDEEVLDRARRRASRPFDAAAVRASARRAGTPVRSRRRRASAAHPTLEPAAARRFVESSRRMAQSLQSQPPPTGDAARDPGDTLIGLLDFVEQVRAFTPARPPEPLAFPPLAQVTRRTEAQRRPGRGQTP